jgi:hypothetical protein
MAIDKNKEVIKEIFDESVFDNDLTGKPAFGVNTSVSSTVKSQKLDEMPVEVRETLATEDDIDINLAFAAGTSTNKEWEVIKQDITDDMKENLSITGDTNWEEENTISVPPIYCTITINYEGKFPVGINKNVTFKVPEHTVFTAKNFNAIRNPVSEDFTFVKWLYFDGNNEVDFTANTRITEDITVYGYYTPIYSVIINYEGWFPTGINKNPVFKVPVDEYFSVANFNTIRDPIGNEDGIFVKWVYDDGNNEVDFTAGVQITGNITVYAYYTPVYSVIINYEGFFPNGISKNVVFKIPENSSFTAANFNSILNPGINIERTFVKWMYLNGGNEVAFTANTIITSNITVYGFYLPNYAVTIDYEGDFPAGITENPVYYIPEQTEFTVENFDSILDPAANVNHTFVRWLYDRGNGENNFTNDTIINTNLRIYAYRTVEVKWTSVVIATIRSGTKISSGVWYDFIGENIMPPEFGTYAWFVKDNDERFDFNTYIFNKNSELYSYVEFIVTFRWDVSNNDQRTAEILLSERDNILTDAKLAAAGVPTNPVNVDTPGYVFYNWWWDRRGEEILYESNMAVTDANEPVTFNVMVGVELTLDYNGYSPNANQSLVFVCRQYSPLSNEVIAAVADPVNGLLTFVAWREMGEATGAVFDNTYNVTDPMTFKPYFMVAVTWDNGGNSNFGPDRNTITTKTFDVGKVLGVRINTTPSKVAVGSSINDVQTNNSLPSAFDGEYIYYCSNIASGNPSYVSLAPNLIVVFIGFYAVETNKFYLKDCKANTDSENVLVLDRNITLKPIFAIEFKMGYLTGTHPNYPDSRVLSETQWLAIADESVPLLPIMTCTVKNLGLKYIFRTIRNLVFPGITDENNNYLGLTGYTQSVSPIMKWDDTLPEATAGYGGDFSTSEHEDRIYALNNVFTLQLSGVDINLSANPYNIVYNSKIYDRTNMLTLHLDDRLQLKTIIAIYFAVTNNSAWVNPLVYDVRVYYDSVDSMDTNTEQLPAGANFHPDGQTSYETMVFFYGRNNISATLSILFTNTTTINTLTMIRPDYIGDKVFGTEYMVKSDIANLPTISKPVPRTYNGQTYTPSRGMHRRNGGSYNNHGQAVSTSTWTIAGYFSVSNMYEYMGTIFRLMEDGIHFSYKVQ